MEKGFNSEFKIIITRPSSGEDIAFTNSSCPDFDFQYNTDLIYRLSVIPVHDYKPRIFHSFRPETLFIYKPDRRPLFEALTGKRALGLSPPVSCV